MDAVAGRGLVLECHLSQLQNWTGKLTFYWERWAGSSRIPATSRRRRHHRHRRLIHQEETSGAALRLASIGQQDEGLYRCVASILSARPVVPARLSDDNVDRVVTNATRIDPVADNGTLIQDIVIEEDDIDLEEESGQKFESKTLYGSFIYVRLQGKWRRPIVYCPSRLYCCCSCCCWLRNQRQKERNRVLLIIELTFQTLPGDDGLVE